MSQQDLTGFDSYVSSSHFTAEKPIEGTKHYEEFKISFKGKFKHDAIAAISRSTKDLEGLEGELIIYFIIP